jgi:serpin B
MKATGSANPMSEGQRNAALGHVVELIAQGRLEEVTDGQLLERYVRGRDETAFAALVRRHGGMVLAVARRILQDLHAAEDAFQATFLILARKAAALDRGRSVAGWLHTVAGRVALNARTSALRRRRQERAAAGRRRPEADAATAEDDLRGLLDAVLQQLPEKYRVPLVLCYLEGKTNEAAARELGWPVGSISKRLAQARALLHDRLTARGVTMSVGLLAAGIGEATAAAAPLIENTVQAATLFATGKAHECGVVSPQVILLAQGVLRNMFLKKILLLGAVVLVLALAGGALALAAPFPWAPDNAEEASQVAQTNRPKDQPAQTRKAGAVPRADRAAVVKANREFALDLYHKLRADKGNLFLSPYSISSALAMTEAGAGGKTREQMRKTLHFALPDERLYPALGSLQQQLNGNGAKRAYELRAANALWGQKDASFLSDYVKLLKTEFRAGINAVDFAGDKEKARQTINAWVARETRNRIKELLKEGHVDRSTRLVLTNAIVFKADWSTRFDKTYTREEPFRGTSRKAKVPLMSIVGEYRFLDGGTFQALEVPFTRNQVSLVVFLPRKAGGLADFEKTLSAKKLSGWMSKLKERQVDLKLPRFRTTASFRLKPTLSALGMPLAFQASQANFSGMTASKGIFLGDVVHQAFLDVNENGAEAVAATAVEAKFGGKVPEQPVVFHADHPFFFVIHDKSSDSILFLGRLVDPMK